MEIQHNYLEKFNQRTIGLPRNGREEMVEKFRAALNCSRAAAGYRPFSYSRLAGMLQHIPTDDLYAFYRQCEGARSFSAYFHWALKPKV
jgi:hypothetical protein